MKDTYILGIESSCDETSVSIVKNGTEEIATSTSTQIDIHKDFGGVVPEIASRHHVKNVTMVLEDCFDKANMTMDDIDAIAITYGPGLIGSLLIGLETAKTLAFVHNKPLIPVHHIAGHIYANSLVKELSFPLLALVVSGGHTEIIEMTDHYKFNKLGGTLDDAIGECYDKVARVIGLEYPGGPKIDKLSKEGNPTAISFPRANVEGCPYDFSFSGVKSAVLNYLNQAQMKAEEINRADVAASFQSAVVDVLVDKTLQAAKEYRIDKIALAGGVASNSALREGMQLACKKAGKKLFYPSPILCTDNAAMIGAAAYYEYKKGVRHGLDLNAVPGLKIGQR